MTEIILMTHVIFGMLCILGLSGYRPQRERRQSVPHQNHKRPHPPGHVAGVSYRGLLVWLRRRQGQNAGPWPFSHSFFMEMKEHVVIMLLLTTYLPIAAWHNLDLNKATRKVVLWVTGLIILIGVAMDGAGAIIGLKGCPAAAIEEGGSTWKRMISASIRSLLECHWR